MSLSDVALFIFRSLRMWLLSESWQEWERNASHCVGEDLNLVASFKVVILAAETGAVDCW